jgi:hypothetical protein
MIENALAEQAKDNVEEFEAPSEQGGEVVSDDDLTAEQAAEDAGSVDGSASEAVEPVKVEAVASQMGWAPKEQWRGDPDKWKPADAFILEQRNITDHLKQELRQQHREFNERVERNERMAKIALQRQRQHLEDSYNQRMREAASVADTDSFDAVMRQKNEALSEFDRSAREQLQPSQQQSQADPAVNQFIVRNRDWYGKDHIMTGAATQQWGYYESTFPNLSYEQIAEAVEQDMRKEFPHKFNGGQTRQPSQQRPSSPSVEGGLRPISGAKKKGWDSLPQEAKRAGSEFIEQGIYGEDKAKAKEKYASEYWEQ